MDENHPYSDEQIIELIKILLEKERDFNHRLKKIIRSFEKIQTGEYGICEECYSPISFTRLFFKLDLDLCIFCEMNEDKQGKFLWS